MAGDIGRTARDLRLANRTAVLRRLHSDGPTSRYELAPATGMSSGSISNVVAELIADGLVEEAGTVESNGGRPRVLLRIAPSGGHMIGIDVGETRVRIELFDLSFAELARTERPLADQGYDVEVIVGHIRDGIAEVLAESGIAPEQLLGVGVGVPGIVARTAEGLAVVHGQTIGWDAVPLEALLRSTCGLPDSVQYFIDNGARMLGQAEMWFGAGQGAGTAVAVLFGSGVGAGLVTEQVEEGRSLEWGHLIVQIKGRRCRCGALGCLDAYAGAAALLGRWREEGGHPPADSDEEAALAAMVDAAYPAEGTDADQVALTILEDAVEYAGAALADLVNLFQPDRIIIGGWAGLQFGTRFLPALRSYAVSYALRYPSERVSIDLGALGPEAVTIGAAILPVGDFFARGGKRGLHTRLRRRNANEPAATRLRPGP